MRNIIKNEFGLNLRIIFKFTIFLVFLVFHLKIQSHVLCKVQIVLFCILIYA